jgi:hypothetical protein
MSKSAMQELIQWYYKEHFVKTTFHIQLLNKFEKLLEKEKEQIEIAFDLGRDEVTSVFIIDGEDYYNKKFNQNK